MKKFLLYFSNIYVVLSLFSIIYLHFLEGLFGFDYILYVTLLILFLYVNNNLKNKYFNFIHIIICIVSFIGAFFSDINAACFENKFYFHSYALDCIYHDIYYQSIFYNFLCGYSRYHPINLYAILQNLIKALPFTLAFFYFQLVIIQNAYDFLKTKFSLKKMINGIKSILSN